MRKIDRTGEINFNSYNSKMTIIKYDSARLVTVEFENGYICETNYQTFKNGEIKNPYDKTMCNIGYLGEGKYKTKYNNKKTCQYTKWSSMLNRCYNSYIMEKQPSYQECTVCEEWHNFQNFAKWYDENYYEIENEKMCLDKDILHKGNKVYSPETCVFVPQSINNLFIKSNSKRGIYPIGVSFKKQNEKYQSKNGKIFNTSIDAFYSYKEHKEKLIKEIAEKNKSKIPNILFNAMLNYKVEIND